MKKNLIAWTAFLGVWTMVYGRDSEDLRVVAARSTLTAISITSTTTTVPLTCIAAISSGTICRRRKSRPRHSTLQVHKPRKDSSPQLDGSVNYHFAITEELDDLTRASRVPRLAFTLWTTSTSAFTYTITSTNAALTFSLSFMCTFPGQTFPPLCG